MFSEALLESGVSHHTRARWTTLASFALQAMLLSMLAIVPTLYPEALSLVRPTPTIPLFSNAPQQQQQPPTNSTPHPASSSLPVRFIAATTSTLTYDRVRPTEIGDPPPPGPWTGPATFAIPGGAYVPPVAPLTPLHRPVVISAPDPASLIHRVQPVYPHIGVVSHTEGTVILHAIISKTGTIESLQLVSGHPLLAPAALDAVRQWRYRPYILNGEAVEVETQITVNFKIANNN